MSDLLRFPAALDVQAATQGRPPRVSILAYGGGVMTPVGYPQGVVVDLARLESGPTIPLLGDHDASLKGVVGVGTPRVDAGRLFVDGSLATTEAAAQVLALARSGVPLQASVGIEPTSVQDVRGGVKVQANGREHTAGPRGLSVIRAGVLREVSILPLGADSSTTVNISARKGQCSVDTATQNATTASVPPETTPPAAPSPDPVRAERDRVRMIRAVCAGEHPDVEARAIDEGWTDTMVKAALLDAIRRRDELHSLRAGRAKVNNIIPTGRGPAVSQRDHLTAACMLLGGHGERVVKAFPDGERLANSVTRPSGYPELCAMALRMEGRDVPHDRQELIRAAFSTTSLPYAIGSSVEKVTLSVFVENSRNWMAITRTVSVSSFRDGKAIRLSPASRFEQVAPSGELHHGNLMEDAFDVSADTYGKIFGIDRQTLVNDDASVLSDLPMVLGSESSRSVADLVFSTLIGNAGSWFSGGHGNLKTSAALALPTLSAAITALRTMKDRDGRYIGFAPTVLAVPAGLETTGRSLLHSVWLQRDQQDDLQPTGNPLTGLNLTLAVEPRLSGDSETTWYVFAEPRHGAVLVSFLNGRMGATVEAVDPPPTYLGVMYRAYLDYGVSLGEYRAAIKNTA